MRKPIKHFALMGALVFSTAAYAQDAQPADNPPPVEEVIEESPVEEEVVIEDDFFDFSLEDLMNVEITSVSKKAERLQDVAASIYVVTNDEILKSGATNLYEVLRTVPGYWGTQSEYNSPFQGMRYSDSNPNAAAGTVLFLLDGTPIQDLMSATFSFKNFDIPLDEIDRIEVIRGSGGTVYGANSATGVINIFTKSPEDYDGINVRAESATPGYISTSLRAGGKINDDLAISGYAKFRQFNGYGSIAGFDEGLELDTSFNTRFTENYDKQTSVSAGLKAAYNLSEKGKLSLSTHFNTLSTVDYTQTYETDFFIKSNLLEERYADNIFKNDVSANRLVGNIRYDHEISEDHSMFARISTNTENDFRGIGGGHKVSNAIYDLEIQDNVSVGELMDISVGANYRSVKYDIFDINSEETINYINAKNDEVLWGVFAQDKIKFLDNKLNVIVGMKAENFSLINDEVYLSPMAKVSWMPVKSFTFWGGFTQSYTTPGYNNTNIDYTILQVPTNDDLLAVAPGVAYAAAYEQAIAAGADEATANGIAQGVASDPAALQATADAIGAELQSQGLPPLNAAVKNGSNTVPTQFQTWEMGFRLSAENRIMFESNAFYSNITDAIGVAPDNAFVVGFSPTQPGLSQIYYLYGNYIKGKTYGTETMFKVKSTDGITVEFAHTWLHSDWEWQKNDDFDISDENIVSSDNIDQTPETPAVPKHTFRLKTYVDLPHNINISLGLIYATTFNTDQSYNYTSERYANLFTMDGNGTASPNNSRTIVNLRIEKKLLDNKLSVYAFGNDVFNEGMVAYTNAVSKVALSKIGGMYGLGANYKF